MFDNILEEDSVDKYGPEKIMLVRDPLLKMEGALVIDNSFYGLPVGGIRIAPNLTIEQLIRLARGMSLKFCTYKIPLSGAQAGIICKGNIDRKNLFLKSFILSIKATIKQADYFPEPDLGIFDTDYDIIFKTLGKPKILTQNISFMNIDEPFKVRYKGNSAYYCLNTVLKKSDEFQNSRKGGNSKPKILLEGFGRVGENFVQFIERDNMELLGVSTIKGAIFDETGLDIDRLFELKVKHGDDLVNEYKSKDLINLESEKLFELSSEYPIDFIIPGAATDIINEINVEKIGAKAIIPASSMPYSKKVIENLKEYNFLAIPDFISNAGEVIELWNRRKKEHLPTAEKVIEQKVSKKTLEILKLAKEKNKPPYDVSRNKALTELLNKVEVKKKRLRI